MTRNRDEFDDPACQWKWMNRQLRLMVDYVEFHAREHAREHAEI